MNEDLNSNVLSEDNQIPQADTHFEEEAIYRKKSPIKKVILAIVALAVVIIAILLTVKIIIPYSQLNKAIKLDEAGKYDEAISIFTEIESSQTSAKLISKVKELKESSLLKLRIEKAQELFDTGDKIGAYKMLKADKSNDNVEKILNQYAEVIIEEISSKIYWEEDDMSDYHWAHAKSEPTGGSLPLIQLYLSQNKNDPAEITYFIFLQFATVGGLETYPLHPQSFRLKSDCGSVDFTAIPSLNDYEFINELDGYTLVCTVLENSTAVLSIDQVNTIADMVKHSESAVLRVNGATKSSDLLLYFSDYATAITDIIEFINIMDMIYTE